MELGWRVSLAQQDKIDILTWQDDEYIRIQVRSSTIRTGDRRKPHYGFHNTFGSKEKHFPKITDYDIVCYVAIELRKCIFKSIQEIDSKKIRVKPEEFKKENIEFLTFEKSLETFRNRRCYG